MRIRIWRALSTTGAFDPDPDGLDVLDWYATRPDQGFRMRFALTAVVAGARAGMGADQPVLP
jgi:hypothetical protein